MAITFLVLLCGRMPGVLASGLEPLTALGADLGFRRNKSGTQAREPASQGTVISGRVVDASTGTPLERVLVAVEGGPSVQTGRDGTFSLPAVRPGRHRLYASLVGFTLVRREIDVPAAGLELTIPLTEGTGTYTEAVTVAGDRFTPAEPGVAAQHVLGSADLQNLRGVLADDPMRAVQALPGVAASDDLRSEFTVRASSFANVNMTVDGFATPHILHTVRAVEDYSGSGSVAMINSDILQDVALLSGSYPQRFGNRTGAEIDFRLREGSRDRTHASFAASGTNASAVLEGPIGAAKRGSWLVSARQSYLDFLIERIDVDNDLSFGFSDSQGKLAFDLSPSQRVDLTVIAGRSRGEERSGDVDQEETFVGRNGSVIANAGWNVTVPRGSVSLRALFARNAFENIDDADVVIDEGYDRQAAIRLDAAMPAGRRVYLEGGANTEWVEEHRRRQRFSAGDYRPINDYTGDGVRFGGYLQARFTAGRLVVVPGARGDRWSVTDDATLSPWLQSQLALPWSLMVRGGTGIYRQFPGFEQVIGDLAASSTRPMRAVHYDLALEQRLGSSIRWYVALYRREEDGFFRRPLSEHRLVDNRFQRGQRDAPFEQSLEGLARGVELMVQRKSARGLSGWVSYAYGRHRYTDLARGESYDSDNDQRHAFNVYGFYRLSDRFSLSAKARVGTNTPAPGYFAETNGGHMLSSRRNEVRLPIYSRVDVRANRSFNWSGRRLTLFAEVINVLNRDNVRFVPTSVNSFTRRVSGMFEQMIPILPSLGVLLEF